MLAMVLVSFAAVNFQALLWQSSQWLVSTVLPAVVVELTNEERLAITEAPLSRSQVLDQAATLKAEDMARGQYFAHYSPDGVTPWHWFDEVGYFYAHAGENLAIHFSDSGEVVDAWMNSPTHKANIVNGNYTEIGVGTAKGVYQGFDTVFVVQLFGTPASAPPAVQTVVQAPAVPLPAARVAVADVPALPQGSAAVAGAETPLAAAPSVTPELLPSSPRTPVGTAAAVGDGGGPASTTLVTNLATSAELALERETTPAIEILTDGTPGSTRPPVVIQNSQPPVTPEIAEVVVLDSMVSMYSSSMATSSGFPALIKAPGEASGTTKVAIVSRLATQPSAVLQIVYMILGCIVATMLLLSVLLGWRAHRPRQMAYSFMMVVLMGGLVTVHLYLTTGAIVG